MKASKKFKQAFLKGMLGRLKQNGVYSKSMSFKERQRAIKISADAAMASARGHATWSNAIIKSLSKHGDTDKVFECGRLNKPSHYTSTLKISRSKKILRRSFRPSSQVKKVEASVIAKRMVKKRTQVLKRLIPGGESLDDLSLLSSTVDYVVHLRTQVDLMRRLAKALGASNLKSYKECCTLQGTEALWIDRGLE